MVRFAFLFHAKFLPMLRELKTANRQWKNSKSKPKFAQTQKKARFLLLNNRKVLLLRCKISAPNLAEHKAIYHTHSENKKQQ